jgi:hypothetical protein
MTKATRITVRAARVTASAAPLTLDPRGISPMAAAHAAKANSPTSCPSKRRVGEQAGRDAAHDGGHAEEHGDVVHRLPRLRVRHSTILSRESDGRALASFRRRSALRRALVGARTALGISTLLARRLSGKAFFLDPEANPQLPVVGRMWSVRDLSLAAGMSAATGTNIAQ